MTQISLDDLLRTAVEQANAGRESSLYYSFDTPAGAVEFYVYITLENDTIVCEDVCIYAMSDPPGIKKSTIVKELLRELRALLEAGAKLGYPGMSIQGVRTMGSSSAKPGKIVNIRSRRKT